MYIANICSFSNFSVFHFSWLGTNSMLTASMVCYSCCLWIPFPVLLLFLQRCSLALPNRLLHDPDASWQVPGRNLTASPHPGHQNDLSSGCVSSSFPPLEDGRIAATIYSNKQPWPRTRRPHRVGDPGQALSHNPVPVLFAKCMDLEQQWHDLECHLMPPW